MTHEDETVDDRSEDDGEASASEHPPRRGLRDVVDRIRSEFTDVTGLEPEATTGLKRTTDGWAALIDVVELARVPRSTDVLATYEVTTDEDGSLRSFDRVHRYRRSEAGSA